MGTPDGSRHLLTLTQPLPLPAEPPTKSLRPNSYLYDLSQLHVAPRDQVELPPEEAVNPCDYIQDQSRNWNEEFQRLLGALRRLFSIDSSRGECTKEGLCVGVCEADVLL